MATSIHDRWGAVLNPGLTSDIHIQLRQTPSTSCKPVSDFVYLGSASTKSCCSQQEPCTRPAMSLICPTGPLNSDHLPSELSIRKPWLLSNRIHPPTLPMRKPSSKCEITYKGLARAVIIRHPFTSLTRASQRLPGACSEPVFMKLIRN